MCYNTQSEADTLSLSVLRALCASVSNPIQYTSFSDEMEGGRPKKVASIVGIICEYDPFHLGHTHQFALIRDRLPSARIVCLMSGCFTQRGMPALHAPRFRAEAALRAGADLVLELPCAFAVRDAERFALGGAEILHRLGFITHLSFGVEDEAAPLAEAAALLEAPTPAFTQNLKAALARGASFASAQGEALAACLGGDAWRKPNNILALCYLRALHRLSSPIQPLPVPREGDYHADRLSPAAWPSASAIRKAFLEQRFAEAEAACGYPLPCSPVCPPDALDALLLHRLRTASPEALRRLPDCTEGLENRLIACARQAASREELLALLKTKRYAYARLSRLCTHALLGMEADLPAHPAYVRLLGFRQSGAELTALFKSAAIPIVAKAADGPMGDPLYRLDQTAYELWALGARQPAGLMLRQGVAVL